MSDEWDAFDRVGAHQNAVREGAKKALRYVGEYGSSITLGDYVDAISTAMPEELQEYGVVIYRRVMGAAGAINYAGGSSDDDERWFSADVKDNSRADFMYEGAYILRGEGRRRLILVLPGGQIRDAAPGQMRRLLFDASGALNFRAGDVETIREIARKQKFEPVSWTYAGIAAYLRKTSASPRGICGVLFAGDAQILIMDEDVSKNAFEQPAKLYEEAVPRAMSSGSLVWQLSVKDGYLKLGDEELHYYSRSKAATYQPANDIGTVAQIVAPANGDFFVDDANSGLGEIPMVVLRTVPLTNNRRYFYRTYRLSDGKDAPQLRLRQISRVFGRQSDRDAEARLLAFRTAFEDNDIDGILVHGLARVGEAAPRVYYIFGAPAGGHDAPDNPDRGIRKIFVVPESPLGDLALRESVLELVRSAPPPEDAPGGPATTPTKADLASRRRFDEVKAGFYKRLIEYDRKAHFMYYLGAGKTDEKTKTDAEIAARREKWMRDVQSVVAGDGDRLRECATDVATMDVVARRDAIATLSECAATLEGGLRRLEVLQRDFQQVVLGGDIGRIRTLFGYDVPASVGDTMAYVQQKWETFAEEAARKTQSRAWGNVWGAFEKTYEAFHGTAEGAQKLARSIPFWAKFAITSGSFVGSITGVGWFENVQWLYRISLYGLTLLNALSFTLGAASTAINLSRAVIEKALVAEYGSERSQAQLRQEYWQTIGRAFALIAMAGTVGFGASGEWQIMNVFYAIGGATSYAAKTSMISFGLHVTSQAADYALTRVIHNASGLPISPEITRTRSIHEILGSAPDSFFGVLRARTRVIPNGSDILQVATGQLSWRDVRLSSPLDVRVEALSRWMSYMFAVQVMGRGLGAIEGAYLGLDDSARFGMPLKQGLLSSSAADTVYGLLMRSYDISKREGGRALLLEEYKLEPTTYDTGEGSLPGAISRLLAVPGRVYDEARIGLKLGHETVEQLGELDIVTDRMQLALWLQQLQGARNAGNFAAGNPLGFAYKQAGDISAALAPDADFATRKKYAARAAWDAFFAVLGFYGVTEKAYDAFLRGSYLAQGASTIADFLTQAAVTAGVSPEGLAAAPAAFSEVMRGAVGVVEESARGALGGSLLLARASGTLTAADAEIYDAAALPAPALPDTGGVLGAPDNESFRRLRAAASRNMYSGLAAHEHRRTRALLAEAARAQAEKEGTPLSLEEEIEADARGGGMVAYPADSTRMAGAELVGAYVDQSEFAPVPIEAQHRDAYLALVQRDDAFARTLLDWAERWQDIFRAEGLATPDITPTFMKNVADDYVRVSRLYGSPIASATSEAFMAKLDASLGDRRMMSAIAGNKEAMSVFTTMLREANPVFDTLQIAQDGALQVVVQAGQISAQKLATVTEPISRDFVLRQVGDRVGGFAAAARAKFDALQKRGVFKETTTSQKTEFGARGFGSEGRGAEAQALIELNQAQHAGATAVRLRDQKPEYFAALFDIVDRMRVAAFDPRTVGYATDKVISAAFAPEKRGFDALTLSEARNVAGLISWGRTGAAREARALEDFVRDYGHAILSGLATAENTRAISDDDADAAAAWLRLETLAADAKVDDLARELQALYAGETAALSEEAQWVFGAIHRVVLGGAYPRGVEPTARQLDEMRTRMFAQYWALTARVVQLQLEHHARQGGPAGAALAYALGYDDPLEVDLLRLDREHEVSLQDRLEAVRVITAVHADAVFAVRAGKVPDPVDRGSMAMAYVFDITRTTAGYAMEMANLVKPAINDFYTTASDIVTQAAGATGIDIPLDETQGALDSIQSALAAGAWNVAEATGIMTPVVTATATATTAAVSVSAAAYGVRNNFYAWLGGADGLDADGLVKEFMAANTVQAEFGTALDPRDAYYYLGNLSSADANDAVGGTIDISQLTTAARITHLQAAFTGAKMGRAARRREKNRRARAADMEATFDRNMRGVYSVDDLIGAPAAQTHPRLANVARQVFRPDDLIEDPDDRAKIKADPNLRQMRSSEIAAKTAEAMKSYPLEMMLAQDPHHPYMVFLITSALALSWDDPETRAKIPLDLRMYMMRYDARAPFTRGPHPMMPAEWSLRSGTPMTAVQSALHRDRAFGFARGGVGVYSPESLVTIRTHGFGGTGNGQPKLVGGYFLVDGSNLRAVAELQRIMARAETDTKTLAEKAKARADAETTEEQRNITADKMAAVLGEAYVGPDGPAVRREVEARYGDAAGPLGGMLTPAAYAALQAGIRSGSRDPGKFNKEIPAPRRPRGEIRRAAGDEDDLGYVYDESDGHLREAADGEDAQYVVGFEWAPADAKTRERAAWRISFVAQMGIPPTVVGPGELHAYGPGALVAGVMAQAALTLKHAFVRPDGKRDAVPVRIDIGGDPFFVYDDNPLVVMQVGPNLSDKLFSAAGFLPTTRANVWMLDSGR